MSITNHITIKKYILGLSLLFSLSGNIAMASGSDNDLIDRLRAGTLNIPLAVGFSKDDALKVVQTHLTKSRVTQPIKAFAKDSWNECCEQIFLQTSQGRRMIGEKPEGPSAFSVWLNKDRQWNAKKFSALCDAAFATTTASSLSYDALIYVHSFLKKNFETSPENKVIEFSFFLLDSVASSADLNTVSARVLSQYSMGDISEQSRLLQLLSPYFQPTYINSFKTQYPDFFGRTLKFFSQHKVMHMVPSIWVAHYLEQDYGVNRAKKDWETLPYLMMVDLLKRGCGTTLNFMAQPEIHMKH